MTLIAGIVSRDPNQPLPAAIKTCILQNISRDPSSKSSIYEDERSFFVKLGVGACAEAAEIIDKNGRVTLIAGEPLLGSSGWQSRANDLAIIHLRLGAGDVSVLSQANGAYCGVHYRPDTGELMMIADKLGLRPLYYYICEEFVLFAGALRILEAIREIPKTMDVRAVTEMVGLGYPLARRTPYTEIKMLRAAEIGRIRRDAVSTEQYFRWDEIAPQDLPRKELVAELFRRFDGAVARRLRDDTATVAYLSGGLDSRCIVASLQGRTKAVHAFNFAKAKTQDQIFGREFAGAIGAAYTEVPKAAGELVPDYSLVMAEVWKASPNLNGSTPERPGFVWSGEGGSVGLGHVHLTEKIVSLMRRGRIDEAIDEHLRCEFAQVSPRLYRKHIAASMLEVIRDGIRDELDSLHHADPARNFYIHLLINDQHRKLAKHFENIDLHGLEFQLPFFDSDFLELIVAAPVDECLRHRLYVKWLSQFPAAVTSVPWQPYPGHEPCPVPASGDIDYQWSKEYQAAEQRARKRRVLAQARDLLKGGPFPIRLLDRTTLRLAAWAHRTGLRDYGYLIGPAHTYYEFVKKSDGQYEMP